MDKSGGCIFLSDKLNLPLVIAWNKTCAKLDKLSSCAAVCVYPKVTSSEGCSAWVQCKVTEQDATSVGFSKGKRKEEKHHESQVFNPNSLLPFLLHWLIIHYRKNRLPADVPTHRGGTWREDVLWIQISKLFLAGAVSSVTGRCRSDFCRSEEPPVLCLLEKKIINPCISRHAMTSGWGTPAVVIEDCVGLQCQSVVMLLEFDVLFQSFRRA